MERKAFEGWAILELMGHRRLAGFLSEQEIAGAAFIRIDVAGTEDNEPATQFYSPAAVYAITPTTEAMVKAAAETNRVEPVSRWELRRAIEAPRERVEAVDDGTEYDLVEVNEPEPVDPALLPFD